MWWKTVGSQGDNEGAEIQKWKELADSVGMELGVKGTAQGVSSEKKKANHPKTGEKQMEMKKIEGLWKLKRKKTENLIGVFSVARSCL